MGWSSCSDARFPEDEERAGAGSCVLPPKKSAVLLRIMRRGQFILSWLQPFTQPPHLRTGIVGEELWPLVEAEALAWVVEMAVLDKGLF